jgi:hypothetical protein
MAAAMFEASAQRRGFPVIGSPANPVVPGVAQPLTPPRTATPGFRQVGQGQSFPHHSSSNGGVAALPYIVPVPVYVGGSENQASSPPQEEDPAGSVAPLPGQPFPIMDGTPLGRLPAIVQGRLQNTEPVPAERACRQPEQERPVEFFIALKDGWVTGAVAYWVREETLHYITLQGSHNMVSLALVDRLRSARLNEGGPVPFILP